MVSREGKQVARLTQLDSYSTTQKSVRSGTWVPTHQEIPFVMKKGCAIAMDEINDYTESLMISH